MSFRMHSHIRKSATASVSSKSLDDSWKYIIFCVTAIIGLALIIWLLREFPPTKYGWMPQCVFYQTTGLHCPGCGGTRAVTAMAQGNFGLAIRCNPFLTIGLPGILLFVWWQRRRRLRGKSTFRWTAWFLFVVVTTFFIARNLPSPTRSPWAPPNSTAMPSIHSSIQ